MIIVAKQLSTSTLHYYSRALGQLVGVLSMSLYCELISSVIYKLNLKCNKEKLYILVKIGPYKSRDAE